MENESFINALNNAIGQAIEQIKSGEIATDYSLYDLLCRDDADITVTPKERKAIKETVNLKNKCKVTDTELKELVGQIGFPTDFPLEIKLFFLCEQIREQYGSRRDSGKRKF